jgi:hypothetical protein
LKVQKGKAGPHIAEVQIAYSYTTALSQAVKALMLN